MEALAAWQQRLTGRHRCPALVLALRQVEGNLEGVRLRGRQVGAALVERLAKAAAATATRACWRNGGPSICEWL